MQGVGRTCLEDVIEVFDCEDPKHAGRNGSKRDGPHMLAFQISDWVKENMNISTHPPM